MKENGWNEILNNTVNNLLIEVRNRCSWTKEKAIEVYVPSNNFTGNNLRVFFGNNLVNYLWDLDVVELGSGNFSILVVDGEKAAIVYLNDREHFDCVVDTCFSTRNNKTLRYVGAKINKLFYCKDKSGNIILDLKNCNNYQLKYVSTRSIKCNNLMNSLKNKTTDIEELKVIV